MAGDIFFDETQVWSANSAAFIDVIQRAIRNCKGDEIALVDILSFAKDVRCLGLDGFDDLDLKFALTQRILAAARECCEELLSGPEVRSDELLLFKILEKEALDSIGRIVAIRQSSLNA